MQSGNSRGCLQSPCGGKTLKSAMHEQGTAGDCAQKSYRWRLPRWEAWRLVSSGSRTKVPSSSAELQLKAGAVPWKQALQENQVRWHVLWAKEGLKCLGICLGTGSESAESMRLRIRRQNNFCDIVVGTWCMPHDTKPTGDGWRKPPGL